MNLLKLPKLLLLLMYEETSNCHQMVTRWGWYLSCCSLLFEKHKYDKCTSQAECERLRKSEVITKRSNGSNLTLSFQC